MMARLSTLLIILIILITSSGGDETRERTKAELCSDGYVECRESTLLLEKILRLLGKETLSIQEQKNEVEYENKLLVRYIKMLRFILANPGTMMAFSDGMPVKSSLIAQPGSLGYPAALYGDCEDLLKCLNDLAKAKEWIASWEEKNINYQSRIELLQAENVNLTSIQEELNQQKNALATK